METETHSSLDNEPKLRPTVLIKQPDVVWMQRSALPAPMSNADFSVWSFVKQCIGKDLTKISMPVALNEPISFLQRIAEYMEYSELLIEAAQEKDPIKRLEYICAFAVSATSSNWDRTGKPFNPLLGETYELHHDNFVFVAEQVSHHPPVTAFHVESEHYRLWSTVQFKLRFWGKSIEVQPKGLVTLELLQPHEWYTWQNPNLTVHNVLLGKIWIEHVGTLSVTNHTLNYSAELEFQPASWFTQLANQVVGKIYKHARTNSTSLFGAGMFSGVNERAPSRILFGNWTRGLFSIDPKHWDGRENRPCTNNPLATDDGNGVLKESEGNDINPKDGKCGPEYGFELPLPDQRCLWLARPRPANSSEFYHFTQFTIGLNELTDSLHEARFDPVAMSSTSAMQANEQKQNSGAASSSPFLPPTDCRFRPDIRALELGNMDVAAIEKNRLEEKQRHVRKLLSLQQSRPRSSQSSGILNHRQNSSGSNETSEASGHTRSSLLLPNNSRSHPVRSRSSVGPRLTVGPVWFQLGYTEATKQEEWKFTGDYWHRDWSRCPDLY